MEMCVIYELRLSPSFVLEMCCIFLHTSRELLTNNSFVITTTLARDSIETIIELIENQLTQFVQYNL